MSRLMLADEHWSKLKPILLQQRIYDKADLRMTVKGILYQLHTGSIYPTTLGTEIRSISALTLGTVAGKLVTVFNQLVVDPDTEWLFIDGSYIKVHQDCAGAATEEVEAIGKSRAGNTSKMHLAVEAYGLPIAFRIT